MCNIMTLLLNNINGIPMKVLDVSSEKKRQNFAKFL